MSSDRHQTLVTCIVVWCVLLGFTDRARGQVEPSFDDIVLWLTADRDVETSDGSTVTAWTDQVGDVLFNGSPVGAPQLVSSPFPSGFLPAIRFNGSSDGILLDSPEEFFLPEMTIHVLVNNVDTARASQCIFANYRDVTGFGMGISDGIAGRVKWFTAHPIDSLEPAGTGGDLSSNTSYVITVNLDSTGTKTLRVNGTDVGSINVGGLTYDAPTFHQLTVGYLQNNRQWFGGDIAEVIAYNFDDDIRTLEVEDYLTQKYLTAPTGPPVIQIQPQSQVVVQGEPVAFSASAVGTAPLSYSWSKDGLELPFAFESSYSIANALLADNGAEFTVQVTNGEGMVTSDAAVLTVLESPDDTPPTINVAQREVFDTRVIVRFSEDVRVDGATDPANYSIDNGVTVDSATLLPSGDVVRLTTSSITAGSDYTLTVNGIQDITGNLIATDSQVQIAIPAGTGAPPQVDLKYWFIANVGMALAEDNATVVNWFDQAGSDTAQNDGTAIGDPQLAVADFPAGPRSVVRFDGIDDGILLSNENDLFVDELTIFIVIHNVDTSRLSQCIAANYANIGGFGLGMSDGIAGRVKWFTANPPDSLEPESGADLDPATPYILTCTVDVDGNKDLRVNGVSAGLSQPGGIDYNAAGMKLTLGYLQGNRQWYGGDIAEVLVYSTVDQELTDRVEGYLSSLYATSGTGAPIFIGTLANQSIAEGNSATFSVIVSGQPPLSYRWMRNGTTIDGETGPTFSIEHVTRGMDGDRFSVEVTNDAGSATSVEAVLTVTDFDDVLPTLESARRGRLDETTVRVVFSERILGSTATVVGNYAIDNGVSVTDASLADDLTTVTLTTSAITIGTTYTLTVNNVQDVVGNAIATNSQVMINVPDETSLPPQEGLALWLDAGEGVTSDGAKVVTKWADLAPIAATHDGVAQGSPRLEQLEFPNGETLPAIRFDGDDGFFLDNDADLFLDALSIYMVVSFDTTVQSRLVIANYVDVSGFALGISDAFAGRVKWFTANPVDSLEPAAGADLENNAQTLLTATMDGLEKVLYIDGVETGRSEPGAITYDGNALTVGFSPNAGGQFHIGTIAEILVYSSVGLSQREEVEEYLNLKYFEDDIVDPRPLFIRGDHDSSGAVDITDSLNRLGFLFLGTTPSSCQEASDFDNSGAIDISDSLNELTFLFLGTIQPPPPGAENCGVDPMEVLPPDGGLPEQANLQLGCEDSFCF